MKTEFFNRMGQERPFEQNSVCSECSGAVKVIASIEDPVVIKRTFEHLKEKAAPAGSGNIAFV